MRGKRRKNREQVLAALSEYARAHPELSQAQLSKHFDIPQTSVSRYLLEFDEANRRQLLHRYVPSPKVPWSTKRKSPLLKCKNGCGQPGQLYSEWCTGEFCSSKCARSFSTKKKRKSINFSVSWTLKKRSRIRKKQLLIEKVVALATLNPDMDQKDIGKLVGRTQCSVSAILREAGISRAHRSGYNNSLAAVKRLKKRSKMTEEEFDWEKKLVLAGLAMGRGLNSRLLYGWEENPVFKDRR